MGSHKKYFPTPVTQMWVEKVGREWQKDLRLLDWDIDWKVLPAKEMDGNFGQNNNTVRRKFAHIYILDKNEYEKGDMLHYDPEVTIVHELLHCHLNTVGDRKNVVKNEEYVIETLSALLVGLKRGGKRIDLGTHLLTSPKQTNAQIAE